MGRKFSSWKTRRYSLDTEPHTINDHLTGEEPLAIVVRTRSKGITSDFPLAITMRTPGSDRELVTGFLITEGIITSADDITSFINTSHSSNPILKDETSIVELAEKTNFNPDSFSRNFFASSSCGVCGKAAIDQLEQHIAYVPSQGYPVVAPELILDLSNKMLPKQEAFSKTGGIHGTGIFDSNGNLQIVEEDVGRHNAMDKVIGKLSIAKELPAKDKIVSVSGRAGFELVQKALIAGFPIMTAVGAPSNLAVELAQTYGMTLIGFLKKDKFNVYCHPERIGKRTTN